MTRRPHLLPPAWYGLLLLLLMTPLLSAFAQTRYGDDPEGYWLGAFVREGSVQVVTTEFTWEDDTLHSAMTIPDWAYYSAFRRDVDRDEHGRLLLQTVYGPAAMVLDTTYQEMVGRVGEHDPALRLHLKRNLRPPQPRIRKDDVTFPSGNVTLAGTIVRPDEPQAHPAIVMIHGRGCSSRQWAMGRAEVLARYGLASLVYDKRGVGESTGDCANATIEDLTDDVLAAIEMMANQPGIDAQQIGVLGSSAGGWVAPRAATRSDIPVAFVITLVGAGTSVEEQQSDNARYITTQRGLSEADSRKAQRYVELMFNDVAERGAQFAEMQALIAHAKETGWDVFFNRTDIPNSPAGIDSLWVRRHRYDPRDDLRQIRVPFLAILGAKDRVVPPKENVPVLRRMLTKAGNESFRIVVLPETGHGLEHGHLLRELPGTPRTMQTYYWKYDRVAPGVMQEIVDFLHTHLTFND